MGKRHLILVGPSGTGKSSVAVQLAGRLSWPWRDTDEQVEQQAGRSVAEIFRELGEPAFRLMESGAVARACQAEPPTVIAVGGGAALDAANRAIIAQHGRVIYLASRAEDIFRRLRGETDPNGLPSRPLLAGSDPLARIREQIRAREPIYREMAEFQFDTDALDVEGVTNAIVAYLEQHPADNITVGDWRVMLNFWALRPQHSIERKRHWQLVSQHPEAFSDERELAAIAEQAQNEAASIRVIVDQSLWDRVEKSLIFNRGSMTFWVTGRGSSKLSRGDSVRLSLPLREQHHYLLPSGEAAKSAAQLERIYEWLAETKTERGDIVIAIGGGATGDVAGYGAATYLRGLRVVQVPTTLLAMVDSAIGGKTAINLPAGKNLVGAFHQPSHIIIDPAWLRTLPPRDYASGWGEICKYAMIESSIGYGSSGLLSLLEQNVALLSAVPSESDVLLSKQMSGRALDLYREGSSDKRLLTKVISHCAGLKAQVVAADEREREGGLRVLLNYGHTLGHALEKATKYDAARLLHGEGVAIGMTAAAMIAERLGLCEAALLARQSALLRAYGLPTDWTHLDLNRDEVLAALQLDKKARGQRVRWVLPTAPGKVELHDDVPPALAAEVIAELGPRQ